MFNTLSQVEACPQKSDCPEFKQRCADWHNTATGAAEQSDQVSGRHYGRGNECNSEGVGKNAVLVTLGLRVPRLL